MPLLRAAKIRSVRFGDRICDVSLIRVASRSVFALPSTLISVIPMNASAPRSRARVLSVVSRSVLAATVLLVGFWLGRQWDRRGGGVVVSTPAPPPAVAEDGAKDKAIVTFDRARQTAAGVRTTAVTSSDMHETLVVTGKLSLNEDRLAHLNSLVEGVLREVHVAIGTEVAAGQVLAVVDSKEVGQAKLELVKNRMNVDFAKTGREWAKMIQQNTQALIAELEKHPAVSDLEIRFRDQPMGDNRQLLIAGYARYHQAKAHHERLRALQEQKVGVEKDFIQAKADFESASATYQATLEQLKYTAKHSLLLAEQKLQEAVVAERMSRASLLILGYREAEIDKMDPLAEGEKVSHYPIRAPFAGTVIDKHAVLSEHVGPTHQLFRIADMTKLWLDADIFEKDVAALASRSDKSIRFRTTSYPGRDFSAAIIHMGDDVDEKSRAVRLIAVVDNKNRLLKAGMFAEVALQIDRSAACLQLPTAAVQREDDRSYVFVATGDDQFERRWVRVGRRAADSQEIVEGVRLGELVVVEGAFSLKSEMLKELLGE
jgi:cobalt-zinc-cadmium efflux system membrane fusion protein